MFSFNPWKGFELVEARICCKLGTHCLCFNPWKGFELVEAPDSLSNNLKVSCFNPWKGFELVEATGAWNTVCMQFSRFGCADHQNSSISDSWLGKTSSPLHAYKVLTVWIQELARKKFLLKRLKLSLARWFSSFLKTWTKTATCSRTRQRKSFHLGLPLHQCAPLYPGNRRRESRTECYLARA